MMTIGAMAVQSVLYDKFREANRDNARLRTALMECAADYMSPPCTIEQGHIHLATEFQRRMNLAAAALNPPADTESACHKETI